MSTPQRTVGGYVLVRQIGAGGMGAVWEAQDASGHRVALKMLHPQVAQDALARKRLQREAQVINRVKSRGVAHVLDLEVDSDQPFVVTELVDGPTLGQDVTRNGAWNREDLGDLAEWLRKILTELHVSGVVHRDIKPSNIMLSAQGPVLIDFGIAQMASDERMTSTGMVTGTPGYLDPQVIGGEDPGPTADWWAWAAVLVFCATGRQPFGSGPVDAVLARVSQGKVDTEGLDPQISIPLLAALRPDPAQRATPEAVVAGITCDPEDFDPSAFEVTSVYEPAGGSVSGQGGAEGSFHEGAPTAGPAAHPLGGAPMPDDSATQPHRDNQVVINPGAPTPLANNHLRAGEAGSVAYRGYDAVSSDTQDVPVSTPWRKRYRPELPKAAPFTGFVEAVIIAAAVMLTRGALLPFLPVAIAVLSIVGSIQRRLHVMRMANGYMQQGDVGRAMKRMPKYIVRALGAVLGSSVVAVLSGWIIYVGLQFITPAQRPWLPVYQAWMFPDEQEPSQLLAVWVMLTLALVAGWWFPAGANYRLGSRYVHDSLLIYPAIRALYVTVACAGCVALAFALGVTSEFTQIIDALSAVIYGTDQAQ